MTTASSRDGRFDASDDGKNVSQFPDIGEILPEDDNPAIRLFGRRFYSDQTVLEYLIEFLLLCVSDKQIGKTPMIDGLEKGGGCFPDPERLNAWPDGAPLKYYPPVRLALKLFSFLGTSNVESRHQSHRDRYRKLIDDLKRRTLTPPSVPSDRVVELVEQVLRGFVGIARDRTWCAHSFLPVSPGLIARETMWATTKGKNDPKKKWEKALDDGWFTFTGHNFLARGGEVLYLQLCNLFRGVDSPEIRELEKMAGHPPDVARTFQPRIEAGLKRLLKEQAPPLLDRLGGWVESADRETWERVDAERKPALCGWCPSESQPESYFFAYEMANICDALLDPIEKIDMLKYGCVMQVLRSFCAQAGRYWKDNAAPEDGDSMQPFAWIVTDPDSSNRALKEAARRNLVRIQSMIYSALRTRVPHKMEIDTGYHNAEKQGQDLFRKLGKKIGLIAPYSGPGARFVLNESLVRYLVLALVPPGKRMRLSRFKRALFVHYGAGIDGDALKSAASWTYPERDFQMNAVELNWLEKKLKGTGFLIPLSDAVSLIHNAFTDVEPDAGPEEGRAI